MASALRSQSEGSPFFVHVYTLARRELTYEHASFHTRPGPRAGLAAGPWTSLCTHAQSLCTHAQTSVLSTARPPTCAARVPRGAFSDSDDDINGPRGASRRQHVSQHTHVERERERERERPCRTAASTRVPSQSSMIGPTPWKCWYVDTHVGAPCVTSSATSRQQQTPADCAHPPRALAASFGPRRPSSPQSPQFAPRHSALLYSPHTPHRSSIRHHCTTGAGLRRPSTHRDGVGGRHQPHGQFVRRWAPDLPVRVRYRGAVRRCGAPGKRVRARAVEHVRWNTSGGTRPVEHVRWNTSGGTTRPVEQLTSHPLCFPFPSVLPWSRSPGRAQLVSALSSAYSIYMISTAARRTGDTSFTSLVRLVIKESHAVNWQIPTQLPSTSCCSHFPPLSADPHRRPQHSRCRFPPLSTD